MTAKCRLCVEGYSQIQAPNGNPNEPIATCIDCKCFICNHHGQFIKRNKHFKCVYCDRTLLAASVAQNNNVPSLTPLVDTINNESGQNIWVKSLTDFEAERPNYPAELFEAARNSKINFETGHWENEKLRQELRTLDKPAIDMLVFAGLMGRFFENGNENVRRETSTEILDIQNNIRQTNVYRVN